MPAQLGGSVLLDYGGQGLQQLGGSVLLSYEPPENATTIQVIREVTNPWVDTKAHVRSVDAKSPATEELDQERKAPWGLTVPAERTINAYWLQVTSADVLSKAPWGKFDVRLNNLFLATWRDAKPADDSSIAIWDLYGDMLNEDQCGVWCGSRPADDYTLAIFAPHSIPIYVPKDYEKPSGLLANFQVAGGSPASFQLPGTVASLYLPLEVQFGPEIYVPHYFGDPLRTYYAPSSNAVNFNIDLNLSYVPKLDELGNHVVDKSAVDVPRLNPWGEGKRGDLDQWVPWTRYSRPLNPGWGIATPTGPSISEEGTVLVPVRSTYIVLNEVQLVTVPGGVELPVQTASVTIDSDSWAWGFNATLPGYCMSYVTPSALLTPVELELVVNGEEYRVLVERVTRTREFGNTGIAISGRGHLAYLSAPYSPSLNFSNTQLRTSQQLMEDALSTNGVSLGWILDWRIPTWDVPANVWSYSGTYIDAALDIVGAVGGSLLPDPKLKMIKVLGKYPMLTRAGGTPGVLEETMPWEWHLANPGIVLPSSVVTVEGIEWMEKPNYNAVYVSGTSQGVTGHVKKAGTAGDIIAPAINNPLITHSSAAREAGRAILGDTGRMAMVTLKIPVLSEIGLIHPGTLVKYVDGATIMYGMCRSLNVSSGKQDDLYQVIEIEVHSYF